MFSVITLLLLVPFSSGSLESSGSIYDLIRQEKYETLKSTVHTYFASNPDKKEMYYYLGLSHARLESYSEAMEDLKNGLLIDPNDSRCLAGLSWVEKETGDSATAAGLLKKAFESAQTASMTIKIEVAMLSLAPDEPFASLAFDYFKPIADAAKNNAKVLKTMGEILSAKGDGSEAMKYFKLALAADSKDAEYPAKIGQLYMKSRSYNASMEYFQQAITIDSIYAPVYRYQAELFFMSRQYDKARSSFQTYIRLSENNKITQRRLATYLFLAKDYKLASEAFAEVTKTDSTNSLILRMFGSSLVETGEFSKGAKIFQSFFENKGKRKVLPTDYAYYGKALSRTGSDSLALINLNLALSEDSSRADLIAEKAIVYLHKTDYQSAVATYAKLFTKRVPSAQDQFSLGRAFYLMKAYSSADSVFNQIIAGNPALATGYFWKARAATGLDPEAKQGLAKLQYEKFIELAAADQVKYKRELTEAWQFLGFFYYSSKDTETAKPFFEKILSLDPQNSTAKEAIKNIEKFEKSKKKKS